MVAAGLMMITLSTARRSVVHVATLEEKTVLETRLEAGVEMVVQDLIEHGRRSHWLNPPGNRGKLIIDGAAVEVSVMDVRGLVDINSSDLALLEQLLSNQLGGESSRLTIERLRESRARAVDRWGTYVDMSAALGLSIEQIACLQPHMTLFSMLDQPDSRYAPDVLRGLLRLHRHGPEQKSSAISEEDAVYGQTYKIIVSTSGSLILSADLVAELMLTGKTDQPYVLRSWIWVPHTNADIPCHSSVELPIEIPRDRHGQLRTADSPQASIPLDGL